MNSRALPLDTPSTTTGSRLKMRAGSTSDTHLGVTEFLQRSVDHRLEYRLADAPEFGLASWGVLMTATPRESSAEARSYALTGFPSRESVLIFVNSHAASRDLGHSPASRLTRALHAWSRETDAGLTEQQVRALCDALA